ncbi:MAG: ATP-binding cassette domain-containing protein [Caldilineaceae bacterium]
MLLSIENISKAFGDNQVLNHVSFSLAYGQKIGLVGANGVGKSTLIKIIIGELESDGGAVQLAGGAEIGYLAQTLSGMEEKTIAQLIDQTLGNLRAIETRLRALEARMAQPADDLGDLLAAYSALTEQFERRGGYDLEYRLDQVMAGLGIERLARDRRVATLSGGEKSRVGLAALLLAAPDLLLLDEPTNHLDFAALAWLEQYLQGYGGGVIVVSHDRQFLNQTVSAIVEIEEHSRGQTLWRQL